MKKISSEDFYRLIGKNVAKYRNIKQLSQMDLSLMMGYKSISVVSSGEIYYKGKHFNLEHLRKISEILETDICHFFNELEE